jgi:4-amino-4-deoxy-L-arabinose transferase-like glycosyltransferase
MPPDAPLPRRALAVLILALAVIWFAGTDYRAIINPDEGRYAEIPREMVVTGDWLTPRLNGLKYFEKPPLQYWMTAAAYEAFGVHPWTSRLWTALSTLLATLFVGYAGSRLEGPAFGLYGAAALAGCGGYIVNAHLLTLDGALGALLTVAFGAFLLAQREAASPREERRWMWVAWAAMAGATLSKGLIGVVIPGASLVLYSLVARDFAVWRRLHLVSGAVLFLVLAAPWFIAVSLANDEFFQFFFIHEHFQRYLTTAHRRDEPWWYFVPLLIVGMYPWLTVLGWGLVRTWRQGMPAANGFSWQRFALVWSAFVFVFFSASGSKLPSYILPMFPVLAFVTGWLLCRIDPKMLARLIWPVAIAAGAALLLALTAYDPLVRRYVGDEASRVPALAYRQWFAASSAAATAGCVIALLALRRRTARARTTAVLAVALSTLIAVQLGIVGYDEFRTTRSSRDILLAAVAANGAFAADAPFFHVHMYDQTVPYYLQRPTTFVEYRDEFALGQDAEPTKAFATERGWIPVWQGLAEGYAMMPASDFERLSAQGLPMRVLARDPRRVVVSRR